MEVDVSDWLGRHVYVTGEYEPATTKLIKNLLAAGGTFVDIGANVGYFTLLAAKCVGRSGRVFSFEPVPQLRRRLDRNLRLNHLGDCEVYGVAVSNAEGTCEFHVGPCGHSGVSGMRALHDASATITVHTNTLDNMLPADVDVSLVKIDVEGAECHVLEGMQDSLARSQPDIILEITPEYLSGMNRSPGQIEQLLASFGYRPFAIGDMGLQRLDSLNEAGASQFNAYFTVPADSKSERKAAHSRRVKLG